MLRLPDTVKLALTCTERLKLASTEGIFEVAFDEGIHTTVQLRITKISGWFISLTTDGMFCKTMQNNKFSNKILAYSKEFE